MKYSTERRTRVLAKKVSSMTGITESGKISELAIQTRESGTSPQLHQASGCVVLANTPEQTQIPSPELEAATMVCDRKKRSAAVSACDVSNLMRE
jgi:hypothetical protein